MATLHRIRLILAIDWENFPSAVIRAKNIHAKMTEHASVFTAPNPSMAILGQQCADFEAAHEAVVVSKAKGASTTRLAKRDLVRASLESERAYVQYLCDGAPEQASGHAVASGMQIWTPGQHNRALLTADLTATQGDVVLRAAASLLNGPGEGKAKKRTYLWRHTIDGGKSFVDDEPTPLAYTRIRGLPLNTYCGFQVAVKDSAGVGHYCQAVTVYIH